MQNVVGCTEPALLSTRDSRSRRHGYSSQHEPRSITDPRLTRAPPQLRCHCHRSAGHTPCPTDHTSMVLYKVGLDSLAGAEAETPCFPGASASAACQVWPPGDLGSHPAGWLVATADPGGSSFFLVLTRLAPTDAEQPSQLSFGALSHHRLVLASQPRGNPKSWAPPLSPRTWRRRG